ncbi:foldase protein PrsA [Paenibacillus sp. 1_12]|uniref:peptidylprolyl isomerase n=1 Tax=Paenibacillus sp. 1_12 TaxID=1566278 RepID=UPI0008E10D95|nr:peptidylprolyl isomerase [Paenibacillus sp. 1_12]SFL31402.1 foldase protein PrsA [Paenibacillus sp. 1_12]
MNDKVKGLVLGLSLGVMLTGSIAYASGTQIEVYFKNIKYMFDGHGKSPTAEQGESFIYNGTTYVPLRFVSEALGKEVQYDGDTETIWVGKKVDLNAIVATYQGGEVTSGALETYLTFQRLLNPENAKYDKDEGYRTYNLKRLIGQQILLSRASEESKKAIAETVDAQVIELNEFLRSTGQDLSKNSLTAADVRSYVELIIGSHSALESQATEERVKGLYDQQVSSNNESLLKASVRHILISNTDAKGNSRSKEVIDQKVKEVQDKLNSGEDFATLAKQYSEDPGSKDNGGLYADAAVSNWVDGFKQAVISLDLNKNSEPIETEFGYHFVRVESRSTISYEEAKEQFKQQLLTDLNKKFNETELPSLIKSISLPKS